MAVPLLFILGGTLLRAAGPAIAKQLVKMGAKKATGKAAQGAAKTVNSNNIGVIKTISRPKSGGAAPKPTPKTSGSGSAKKPTTNKKPASSSGTSSGSAAKPSGSGRNAGGRKKPPTKKKPPELKVDPSMRLGGAKPKPKPSGRNTARNNKKPVTGDKAQRGLIVAATALPMFMDTKPTGNAKAKDKPVDKSNRATSKGGRGFGEGTYKKSSDSFGAAFKKAYGKGVGTKFTHKGKSYTAVKDTDLKKAGVKTLREYLNKKKKKG